MQPSINLLRGILRSPAAELVRPAVRRARRVQEWLNDCRLGIMTADDFVLPAAGSPSPGTVRVLLSPARRPVPYRAIRLLMRRIDPRPGDRFLDIGCGSGRVICVATRYAFSQIIGVEIDEILAWMARRNVSMLYGCSVRPEIVIGDAATFRVPDDITVAFLYNPFAGEVMRAALTRIVESFDRHPRRLTVAYANPLEHDLLMSLGRFRETAEFCFSWRPGAEWQRTQMIRLYEVLADGRD